MDGIRSWADNFIGAVREWADGVIAGIAAYLADPVTFGDVYTLVVRWILPVLSILIFVRCVLPLLHGGSSSRIWGFLEVKDAYRIPVMHWENSIGRSKLCDIVINLPFISRSHAVLSYGENGWTITDLGSKGGVKVNGVKIENTGEVAFGDTISFATAEFQFVQPEEGHENLERRGRMNWLLKFSRNFASGKTLLLILVFQLLGGIQLWLSGLEEVTDAGAAAGAGTDALPGIRLLLPILLLMAAECTYYYILSKASRKYREPELLVFFLCGLNLFVTASASPAGLTKQLVAILLGMAAYAAIQYIIKDVGRGRQLKYALVACSIVLMLLNLTLGEARFGAKNWINLGFITFQPMEFVKVAFVLAGTATLDKLLTTRNLTAFIGFSGACIGALILMRDLGTSVVFFTAFLVIAFMRSGDVRTIALISAGAALGAFAVITFLPYIASRFEAWGHVWEYADTIGYQQTRTMIAVASGGLLGVGGGNGYLERVAAADTDLVFGILCEEWGLITALIAVLIIVFLAFFVLLLLMRGCKSSFYAISACGAASIYLIQTALNVFGSLDLLPLTGVTLPFVSNGGSSMVVCWALLSFIKAADERRRPDSEEENENESSDELEAIDNLYELDEFSEFAIFDELKRKEDD